MSKIQLFVDDEDKRRWMKALRRSGVSIGVLAVYYWVLFAHIEPMPGSLQATLVIGGLIVGATFLVVFIRKAIIGPDARPPLPSSVRMVTNYRARLKRPFLISGICCASASAISLRFPYNKFFSSFFWAILFLFLVYLRLSYTKARSLDRSLTVLKFTGSPIHWRFAPELWQQWIEAEVARIATQPPDRRAKKLRRQLAAAAPEAYFGDFGYSCAGAYASWSEFECRLASAGIDTISPRRISFAFHRAKKVLDSKNYIRFDEVRTVPIPPGGEADLAVLQRQLDRRCPEARVTLL